MRIYVYDRQDAGCAEAIRKLSEIALKPGIFIPLTEDQFEGLRGSMMSIDVPDQQQGAEE